MRILYIAKHIRETAEGIVTVAVDLAYTQSDKRHDGGCLYYMLTRDKYGNLLGSQDVQQYYPRMRKSFFGKAALTSCACAHHDRFMVRRKEEDINDLYSLAMKSNDH